MKSNVAQSLPAAAESKRAPEGRPVRQERAHDQLLPAIRATIVTLVLTGLLYPLVMTGLAQGLFHRRASGSFVSDGAGKVVGSELLAQAFSTPLYFHPRPSAAGERSEERRVGK